MTDLNKMWETLASHQPIADRKGYGSAWAKMCKERTSTTAFTASHAVNDVVDIGNVAYAAHAAAFAAHATDKATDAIGFIEKANKEASHE